MTDNIIQMQAEGLISVREKMAHFSFWSYILKWVLQNKTKLSMCNGSISRGEDASSLAAATMMEM